MTEMNQVTILRLKLRDALGDNAEKYFETMKNWFRMKIGKDEFDYQCRSLMGTEACQLHNQFILALLKRCSLLAEAENSMSCTPQVLTMQPLREHRARNEDKRSKKQKTRDRGAFEAVDIVDYIIPTPTYPPLNTQDGEALSPIAPIPYEAFLPDSATLMCRFLLTGWDHGMENAEEEAVRYLSISLKLFLKSVLLAVFQQRSGFRLRDDKILYGLGTPVPNPWLKNSIHLDSVLKSSRVVAYEEMRSRPSHEEAEQRAAYELACATSQRGHATSQKPPVSLFDLYDALKLHKSVIKSHMLYAMTMERIIARLDHPSHEDITASNIAL